MAAAQIAALRQRVQEARTQVERKKAVRDALAERRDGLQRQLAETRRQVEQTGQVAILLRESADHAREKARERVETLVSRGLQSVFGPGYAMALVAGESGGKAVIDIKVVKPYGAGAKLETGGIDASGGGVVDLESIAVRWAMLESVAPRIEGPLVLDEPAKHVSADYIPAVADFLSRAHEAFGRQVLMVTHNQHLAELADQTIRLELHDGVTRVVQP